MAKGNNDTSPYRPPNISAKTKKIYIYPIYMDVGLEDLSISAAEHLEFHLQEGSRPRSLCLHRFIFQFISLPYDRAELLSEMAGHQGIPLAEE